MTGRFIFTHDGIFHCDEVAAVAVAVEAGFLASPNNVRRTRRDFGGAEAGDLVIDVTPRTPVADGVIVADHHTAMKDDPAWQRGEGKPRLASAGWAWREFGKTVLSSYNCPGERLEQAWENVDRSLFWGIDAADNGELPPSAVPSYTVSQAVAAYNPVSFPMADQDELFHKAVAFFRDVFKRVLWAELYRQHEYSRIKAAIDAQWCDPVLVLDRGGAWQSVIIDNWDATDYIKVVVYPDAAAPGLWRIQSAPGSKTDPFAMRCGAPAAMRGKRADAGLTLGGCAVEFVHPAGFIGGVHAATAEDARRAALDWIGLA